jgi:hypothetical protein
LLRSVAINIGLQKGPVKDSFSAELGGFGFVLCCDRALHHFLDSLVHGCSTFPEIWRLLEVLSTMTLNQLHQVLQVAFGWEDIHLHRFSLKDPFAQTPRDDARNQPLLKPLPSRFSSADNGPFVT